MVRVPICIWFAVTPCFLENCLTLYRRVDFWKSGDFSVKLLSDTLWKNNGFFFYCETTFSAFHKNKKGVKEQPPDVVNIAFDFCNY